MDIIRQLEEEHKRIIQKINRLPGTLTRARQDLEALQALSQDIEKELSRHERIEDDLVFPALREKISEETLRSLSLEHEESRKVRDLFLASIAEVKILGINSRAEKIREMSGHGYKLMRILSTHLTREDKLLFPMARAILTRDQSEELFNRAEAL